MYIPLYFFICEMCIGIHTSKQIKAYISKWKLLYEFSEIL